MFNNPLSAVGFTVSFDVFPFIPDDVRIPYDCPHLSWLGIEEKSLSEQGLGKLFIRVNRYVIQDLGDIPFVVADTLNNSRGFIVYNDMNPVVLNSNILAAMDNCESVLRNNILKICYPEDLMVAFLKAQEPGFNIDKIIEYLSSYRVILESY